MSFPPISRAQREAVGEKALKTGQTVGKDDDVDREMDIWLANDVKAHNWTLWNGISVYFVEDVAAAQR